MTNIADLLIDLVRIDSESGDEERFLVHLTQLLRERFNASCERDSFGNLIARISGINSTRTDPVLFGVHADTVSPGRDIRPILKDGVLRSSGETILGSDDKAGIAELVIAMERASRRPPIELLVTREEEIGLRGSKNADLSLLEAKMAFVIDGADFDRIVVGGPTLITLDITIHGRAAHAGMRPEEGISALQAAAIAMASLPLGRVDEQTTCNVGMMKGGTARNAIPTQAEIQAECRSLDHDRCVQIADFMQKAFEQSAADLGASIEVSRELCYKASRLPESLEVVRVAVKALHATGLVPRIEAITGGTDALVLANRGLQAVVLGMGNRGSHTVEENISVGALECGATILANLLDILAVDQHAQYPGPGEPRRT